MLIIFVQIPVYKGASNAILWTPPSDNYFGKDGFGDFEFVDPPDPNLLLQKEHAVDALVRIVSEYPGNPLLLDSEEDFTRDDRINQSYIIELEWWQNILNTKCP